MAQSKNPHKKPRQEYTVILYSYMPIPLLLETLPGLSTVWRADEMARSKGAVIVTGSAVLDAVLPGGGWPVGAVVEILQATGGTLQNRPPKVTSNTLSNMTSNSSSKGSRAGVRGGLNEGVNGRVKSDMTGDHCEWRLLLPALVRVTHASSAALVLVGAPHAPFAPGLAGQGLDPHRLLCIDTAPSASRLWATEQALRCKDVAAVLAWFPHVGTGQVRADQLRRLHMAAAEHSKLLFVMRPAQAQAESSPAVLRLLASTQAGSDALLLRILKRRGPPLDQPVLLPARPARLAALLAVCGDGGGAAAAQAGKAMSTTSSAPAKPATVTTAAIAKISVISTISTISTTSSGAGVAGMTGAKEVAGHALDRIAAAA